jgi:dTDP-4-amino-4,6-dideoxygalactose transaminase
MHLALEAVGLQSGDEVITTPYTFAATAEVIRYFDARPVLVDINEDDFNINVDLVRTAVNERTKAIIPVHIAGLPANLTALWEIADYHNLAIIEDAAHAFPSRHGTTWIGQRPVQTGSVQHLICYSFYATKTLTTGEGGMLVTDDDGLAERCRIMSLHGIGKDAWKRYTAEGSWYYEIVAPGYKYNMTDIAAAMGLAQLSKADRMWQRRREIAQFYNRAFNKMLELQIPHDRSDSQHAWHLYMLRLNLDLLTIERRQFVEELKKRNIGSSVHFIPLHLHPYYRDTYGYKACDFPIAYKEYQREISLPIYSKMTEQDVQDVVDAVKNIIDNNKQ